MDHKNGSTSAIATFFSPGGAFGGGKARRKKNTVCKSMSGQIAGWKKCARPWRRAAGLGNAVRRNNATSNCLELPWTIRFFFFFFLSFLYLFLTSLTNNDQTGDPLTLHDFSRILLLLFFFVHQGFFVPRIDLQHTRSFSESRERCFSFAQVELFSNKREFWCSCISTDNRRELRIFQIYQRQSHFFNSIFDQVFFININFNQYWIN